jgi:hypothetical protein
MGENSKIQWTDPRGAATKIGLSAEQWNAHRMRGEVWCYCCRQWLDGSKFGTDKSRSSGKASACKTCVSHKGTAFRYRISIEEARRLRSGDAVCEICKRTQKLEVDHDHLTGKVRGVLCSRCNGALGQFLDDVKMLQRAITYLEVKNGSK